MQNQTVDPQNVPPPPRVPQGKSRPSRAASVSSKHLKSLAARAGHAGLNEIKGL
jgi:hypothetical protein